MFEALMKSLQPKLNPRLPTRRLLHWAAVAPPQAPPCSVLPREQPTASVALWECRGGSEDVAPAGCCPVTASGSLMKRDRSGTPHQWL